MAKRCRQSQNVSFLQDIEPVWICHVQSKLSCSFPVLSCLQDPRMKTELLSFSGIFSSPAVAQTPDFSYHICLLPQLCAE